MVARLTRAGALTGGRGEPSAGGCCPGGASWCRRHLAFVSLVLVLGGVAPANAQDSSSPAPPSFFTETVPAWRTNAPVRVLTTDGEWVTGRIMDVRGSVISLLVREQGRRDIERDRVWEVWQPARRSGALKGLTFAAALMLGLGAAAWAADECRNGDRVCAPGEEFTAGDLAVGTVFGALIGAVVGRVVAPPKSETLLYVRPSASSTAARQPASRGSSALAFTVRF